MKSITFSLEYKTSHNMKPSKIKTPETMLAWHHDCYKTHNWNAKVDLRARAWHREFALWHLAKADHYAGLVLASVRS